MPMLHMLHPPSLNTDGTAGKAPVSYYINAVSDGGGAEERSSVAMRANHGYTQASLNDNVEDLPSLRDPKSLSRTRYGRQHALTLNCA